VFELSSVGHINIVLSARVILEAVLMYKNYMLSPCEMVMYIGFSPPSHWLLRNLPLGPIIRLIGLYCTYNGVDDFHGKTSKCLIVN
jgi:hypothetical protein